MGFLSMLYRALIGRPARSHQPVSGRGGPRRRRRGRKGPRGPGGAGRPGRPPSPKSGRARGKSLPRRRPHGGQGRPRRSRGAGDGRASEAGPGAGRRRGREVVAYHGTPSAENARSILRDGWLVGSGNALGDGIYLATDPTTARSYAGSRGVYVKCRVDLGRTCQWTPAMQARFAAWCRSRGVTADRSAVTAFLLRQGYDTVRNGNVLVVLAPQYANPAAWKRKSRRIRVLGVYSASTGRPVRV